MTHRTLFSQKLNNKWQKIVHSDIRQSTTKKIAATIIAIFCAFAISIIIACSVCGTWGKFGEVISTIFTSGYQTKYQNTLFSNMAILIVGGLAFVFAYKAGLFNIGISGQMIAGGTAATLVCHLCKIPAGLNQVVILIISMGVGALVAGIIGALKAYLRVNEVVSSIMFNWIIYFMSILLLASFPTDLIPHDASNLNTNAPADSLLFRLNGESWIPLIIIAIGLIVIVSIVLKYTVFGRKQRVTGLSNTGALAAGYNVKGNMIASMAISGAISGILGVMLYCGFSPNMPVTAAAKAIPQEGFNGISVGLISMCSPVASVPVSLFFSMIKTSVSDLQMLGIDNHIADVIFGIVVYGAAAIALFLNIKPYWFTIGLIRGKNYSKIKHERNMTNIELLSISSDQCAVLRKYFVYYQKTANVKSTLKLSPALRYKMWWANIRYNLTAKKAQRRVKRNTRICIYSHKPYLKQEMVHVVAMRNILIADLENKKHGGWYIKLDDHVLADKKFADKIQEATEAVCRPNFMKQLHVANDQFKEKPFNDREIRMLPKLVYLHNLRSGLIYRDQISKENKLSYFTFMQTKEQAESIGLSEIRSKKQYTFAHSAYFKAYQRTFDVVNNHYDTMVRTFGKDKKLNIYGIRFDSATLAKLFYANLKDEIANIAHLINCPLNKNQLTEVGTLVTKASFLRDRIKENTAQSTSNRAQAVAHANKFNAINKDIVQYQEMGTKNTKKIANIAKVNGPLTNAQIGNINMLANDSARINKSIVSCQNNAASEDKAAKEHLDKSRKFNEAIVRDKEQAKEITQRLAVIAAAARKAEAASGKEEYDKLKASNAEVDKELQRIAKKQENKELKELKRIKMAKLKARKQKEKEQQKAEAKRAKILKQAIVAAKAKKEAKALQKLKDEEYAARKIEAAQIAKERAEHKAKVTAARKALAEQKAKEKAEVKAKREQQAKIEAQREAIEAKKEAQREAAEARQEAIQEKKEAQREAIEAKKEAKREAIEEKKEAQREAAEAKKKAEIEAKERQQKQLELEKKAQLAKQEAEEKAKKRELRRAEKAKAKAERKRAKAQAKKQAKEAKRLIAQEKRKQQEIEHQKRLREQAIEDAKLAKAKAQRDAEIERTKKAKAQAKKEAKKEAQAKKEAKAAAKQKAKAKAKARKQAKIEAKRAKEQARLERQRQIEAKKEAEREHQAYLKKISTPIVSNWEKQALKKQRKQEKKLAKAKKKGGK